MESLYERLKGTWEERFEARYGSWRGFVDAVVARYLDCGLLDRGFARVYCDSCRAEFLVALSCKGRGLCPSCGAKRAALFAAFLHEQVLEPVDHAQWVFTIPKMLRPYFRHHRELLGSLCRAAYETVRAMMVEAAGEPQVRPGMVAVVQTFGDQLNWNPHIHAIVSRGGWLRDASWIPLPHLDAGTAELIFRHKVLKLLKRAGLLDEERLALLLSWEHHTGFSVHNAVTVGPDDAAGLERLARYLLRSPLSLERACYDEVSGEVRYRHKAGHDADEREASVSPEEKFDPFEFLARVLVHVPAPRLHSIRYFGAYSAVVRARRRDASTPAAEPGAEAGDSSGASASSDARRLRWADLIRRIYEVDPLLCPRCGATMRIVAFITQPRVIRKILDHLEKRTSSDRAPPSGVSSELLH